MNYKVAIIRVIAVLCVHSQINRCPNSFYSVQTIVFILSLERDSFNKLHKNHSWFHSRKWSAAFASASTSTFAFHLLLKILRKFQSCLRKPLPTPVVAQHRSFSVLRIYKLNTDSISHFSAFLLRLFQRRGSSLAHNRSYLMRVFPTTDLR